MAKLLIMSIFSFLLILSPLNAYSHAMAPSLLKITQTVNNDLVMAWKQPIKQAQGTKLFPIVRKCSDPKVVAEKIENDAYVQNLSSVCPHSSEARLVFINGIDDSSTYVMVEWNRNDGSAALGLIDKHSKEFLLSNSDKPIMQFFTQILSGSSHLLVGYDHILFILGLLFLLNQSLKNLVVAFTCFTFGHTASLFVASYRIVTINSMLIEMLILVSLVWMALEVLANKKQARYSIRTNPYFLTFGFGLIHGFGFSNVLSAYLDTSESIVSQVLAFNIGVEIGQIVIVLFAYPLFRLLQKKQMLRKFNGVVGYSIGSVSVYWMLQMI